MRPGTDDPLVEALIFFGKQHSRPVNLAGATQGLPLIEGRLTPELFARAARRCGFECKVVRRPLNNLHSATFPVVLVLKGNEAVILNGWKTKNEADLILLSSGHGQATATRSQLNEAYTGIAIFVKPTYQFEDRADFNAAPPKKSWFWGTLWRYRSFYYRVAIATAVINVLALASSLFVMNVYDRVVPNEAVDTLFVLAIGVVLAYIFEFALKMLRMFFVDRAGHRIDLRLGSEIFSRVLGMRFRDRPGSAGALASQARSYEALREFFTSATITALVDLPFIFVFVSVIYLLGGAAVALPLLAGLGLALAVGSIMQFPIRRAVSDSYSSANQRQALFVEGIQAIERIKATRSESEMQARMEEALHVSAKSEIKSRGYAQLSMNTTAFIQHMVSTAIVISAFFQVTDEKMTMGAMIACVILSGRAMGPMAVVASLMTRVQQSFRSLKGLNQIMNMAGERDNRAAQVIRVDLFRPEITIESLSFSYDPQSVPVLNGLNLKVQPGERIGILGKVGSGKSTLMRILMGFEDPTDGHVDVSGIDLRQFDHSELRSHIGYLPQDPALLYGTLRSNLKAGCPWVDDNALLRAIDIAGLTELIRIQPRGIDQTVVEGGQNYSGGQRQAIAIARAVIEEPELLLLDEPTSAMDLASEKRLIDKLKEYLDEDPNRTLILSTHKRSLLSLVDRVVVLDSGRIVADGPRDKVFGLDFKSWMTPGARVGTIPAPPVATQPAPPRPTAPAGENDVSLPS